MEKVSGESSKAYQAFLDYWNLGPSRSLRELERTYQDMESAPTKSYATISGWSSKFKWFDRVSSEIDRIAAENKSIANEEHQKLFAKQFDLIHNILDEVEPTARLNLDYEGVSIAQYNMLMGTIWKMLADLRTNDTKKIALTDPSGTRSWEGKIEKSDMFALANRLTELKKNE